MADTPLWLGAQGERARISGTITSVDYVPTQYGTTTVCWIDSEGRRVRWTHGRRLDDLHPGTSINVSATVKGYLYDPAGRFVDVNRGMLEPDALPITVAAADTGTLF